LVTNSNPILYKQTINIGFSWVETKFACEPKYKSIKYIILPAFQVVDYSYNWYKFYLTDNWFLGLYSGRRKKKKLIFM